MRYSSHLNPELLAFAFQQLSAHKFRSLLTVLGIIIGIVTVVLVATVLIGVRANVVTLFEEFGPDNIFVFHLQGDPYTPTVKPEEITRKPLKVEFASRLVENCPSVESTAVQVMMPNLVGGRALLARYRRLENDRVLIQGVSWTFAAITRAEVRSGRNFTSEEERRRARVCMIGPNIEASLFPAEDPLGKRIEIDSALYQVVGVLEKRKGSFLGENRQDNAILIPANTIRNRYPEVDLVVFYCHARPNQRETAFLEIEAELRRLRGLKADQPDDFVMSTSDMIIQQLDRVTAMIRIATLAISGLGLLVGGIGVMNIMLMSVTQRTREIGIRKAIGARRKDILLQFMLEASLLTGLGGTAGVVLAFLLGLVLHWLIPNMPAVPPIWAILMGLGMSVSVGMVFGVWPAMKAARLDPVESLRYE
jgi:putative ABC transport system permease protein